MRFHLTLPQSQLNIARPLVEVAEVVTIRLKKAEVDAAWTMPPDSLQTGLEYKTVSVEQRDEQEVIALTQFTITAVTGSEHSEPVLTLRALFELQYHIAGDHQQFTEEQLTAFGASSVLMNAWPYWREYAHNTVVRIGLPPMVVPLLTLRAIPESKPTAPRKSAGPASKSVRRKK